MVRRDGWVSGVVRYPVKVGNFRESSFFEAILLENVFVVGQDKVSVAQPFIDFGFALACCACFGVTRVEGEKENLCSCCVP